jgi:HEAT repeat protein
MDKQRVKSLIRQCASDDPNLQVGAVLELSDNKIYGAVPTLIKLISSPNGNVRGAVAEALGYLGRKEVEEVGPALLRLLSDPDYLVRDDAVESLGMLVYLPAREAIEHILLNDSEWVVRASAAEALGYLGDQLSLSRLKVALAKDEIEVVRGWAAHSLGLLGSKEVLSALASQLEVEEVDNTRIDILAARYRLGSQSDLKLLLDLSTTNDNAVIYGIVNRLENLLELKNPPTLAEDVPDIQRALTNVVERFPLLQIQIGDIVNKLLKIKSTQR